MESLARTEIPVSMQENTDTKEKRVLGVRNANARQIFKNAKLTSQFLKNYTELPIFSNVTPEDIEDVSDHYRAYLGIEFESDTVKRVRVRVEGKERHVFVIPLIEHKSYVDYDVAMQLLRYMVLIWYEYAKEQNAKQKDISHTKSFRYPLIIPIVYYEGSRKWTAASHLVERIENGKMYMQYIPDFVYKIVQTRDYTNEDLQKKHDEMSLVMLFNKIQTPQDYSNLIKNMEDFVNSVYREASEDIRKIVMEVLWSLFMKMNVPVDEAQKMVEEVEKSGMGYLFENFEKCDIQEERRKTKEARAEAEEAKAETEKVRLKLEEAEAKAEEAEAKLKEAKIKADEIKKAAEIAKDTIQRQIDVVEEKLVSGLQKEGCTKEEALEKLQKNFAFEETGAKRLMATYWK